MKFTKAEKKKNVGECKAIFVPLAVYDRISEIAEETNRPKTYIATALLEDALKDVEVAD